MERQDNRGKADSAAEGSRRIGLGLKDWLRIVQRPGRCTAPRAARGEHEGDDVSCVDGAHAPLMSCLMEDGSDSRWNDGALKVSGTPCRARRGKKKTAPQSPRAPRQSVCGCGLLPAAGLPP